MGLSGLLGSGGRLVVFIASCSHGFEFDYGIYGSHFQFELQFEPRECLLD
jgi:hypothetical protein